MLLEQNLTLSTRIQPGLSRGLQAARGRVQRLWPHLGRHQNAETGPPVCECAVPSTLHDANALRAVNHKGEAEFVHRLRRTIARAVSRVIHCFKCKWFAAGFMSKIHKQLVDRVLTSLNAYKVTKILQSRSIPNPFPYPIPIQVQE